MSDEGAARKTNALDGRRRQCLLRLALSSPRTTPSLGDTWDKMDAVLELLAERVSPESGRSEACEASPNSPRAVANMLTSRTVGQILDDAETPIETLLKIKDTYKAMARSAAVEISETPETATTVYYACIAHALVHQGRHITSLPQDGLEKSFLAFAQERWVPKALRELFAEAAAARKRECAKTPDYHERD